MPGIFDTKSQLTFYGAYHTNKVNVAIHMVCVPLIVWSTLVWLSAVPLPSVLSAFEIKPIVLNDYMMFEPSFAWIFVGVYTGYYLLLEPVAALLYIPHVLLSLSTATSFAHRSNGLRIATVVHVVSWIMQFIGHGKFEGRAPALLDNIAGALFLAPFFVHMELLFILGYRPKLYKEFKNSVGVEVTKVRKEEASKKRAQQQKSQ